MTTNWKVLLAFLGFAVAICLLAAFGGQLGMSHGALVWCQTIAALIGTFVASQMPAIFARVEAAIEPPKPQPVPPSRTDGSASLRAMGFVLLAALFGLAGCALLLPSCGASALSQHASGVAVAMVALRGAEDAADAERRTAEDACHDAACIAADQASRADLVSAIDTARVAILTWRDAVAVAAQATQPSADLMGALETAAARAIARWDDLAAAQRARGGTLPTLPASVAALVPGGAS